MSTLIIAEHNNINLNPSTLNTINAAQALKQSCSILVVGKNCKAVAESAAKIQGIEQVYLADSSEYQHQLAENVAPLVVKVAADYATILTVNSTTGKNLLPRVAALLDVGMISDVIEIKSPTVFKRPIYAGNVIATVESLDPIKIMTIRPTAFNPAKSTNTSAPIIIIADIFKAQASRFEQEIINNNDKVDIQTANIVISGGRGLKNKEHFLQLEKLATKIGAAIGASRAAVDAGFASNDIQIGQTGKIVAPDLYIAVGISGAIQHLAGMKESKVIVAINTDEEAPIFQIADYGLVMDLFQALPELEAKLA
jgi:electron transfer flavoprotein alpha subunit